MVKIDPTTLLGSYLYTYIDQCDLVRFQGNSKYGKLVDWRNHVSRAATGPGRLAGVASCTLRCSEQSSTSVRFLLLAEVSGQYWCVGVC